MADQLMDGSKTELILNEQMGQTIVDREINVPQVPRFCLPVFLLENQGAAELSGYHLSIQLWRRCTPCSSNPVSTYHYDIPRESGHPIAICNGWCRTSAPPPPMCLLAEVSLSFFFIGAFLLVVVHTVLFHFAMGGDGFSGWNISIMAKSGRISLGLARN